MEIITELDKIDKSAWKDFMENHPKGNIFQSPQMVSVFLNTKHYIPVTIFAIDNSKVIGVLISVIQKELKGFLGYFTSRCITHGVPLAKNDEKNIVDVLLNAHSKIVKHKSIYSQFRNTFDSNTLKPVFKKYGYQFIPHLNIHINLSQSFTDLKKDIHKSRLRNYTKANNKGVEFKIISSLDEIVTGYSLLRETYGRINLPLPDYNHFKSIFENLGPLNNCMFFGLYFNNEMIGFRVFLLFNKVIHDYYAGSALNHSNKYPNDFLILKILEWGCLNDYDYFDFGGAGKPNQQYGVREHKLQFSKNIVEFGRFEKINNYFFYNIIKGLFNLWKKIKK